MVAYLPMFTGKMQNYLSNCLAFFYTLRAPKYSALEFIQREILARQEKNLSSPSLLFFVSLLWEKYCFLTIINIHKFDIQVRK